ncbi:hypothetical protein RRG08_034962 [Elysia crispata]|uniref:Uncharacterized protein n=1 Tax=Elysia crispata TaxID=231223 RepID=A0AAE0Y3I5_9GAST|nr:hypothetical protein RRG08_034962 [Elysia crispata]
MLIKGLCLLHALLWSSVYAHLPMWKNLLTHHQQWDGRYTYRHANSSLYDCSLRVMSLGQKENSESYLILTADHIDIDMKIDSEDDTIIYLQEDAVWRKTKYFEDHTDIRIVGEFVSDHLYYMFLGNVSSAEEENFASMALRPRGFLSKVSNRKQSHLNYGLVYGIPVSCAALLMVAGIMIIFWAVRKGYIRSLSWSYKNFNNPSDEPRPQPSLEMKGSRDEPVSLA